MRYDRTRPGRVRPGRRLRLEMLEPRLLLSLDTGWDGLACGPDSASAGSGGLSGGSGEDLPEELRAQLARDLAADGVTSLAGALSYSTLSNGMPVLHSRTGAAGALFMDFDGNTGASTTPYDEDGDSTTFNTAEQTVIVECWRQTAIYYAMFDLDVTTIQPDVANVSTAWAAIGNSVDRGYSYVNVYPNRTEARSFISSGSARSGGLTVVHEIGHNLGDSHQSVYDEFGIKTAEYAGPTDELHGPLMGGYGGVVTKWSIGHPSGSSSSLQDDMAVIANNLRSHAPTGYAGDGYAPDDFAGTLAAATPLAASGSSQSVVGVIERLTDADAFSFTSAGGRYSIVAGRDNPSGVDLKLSIYDSSGSLLASEDGDPRALPLEMVDDQSITLDLAAGTYYAVLESHGNYCDQGQYVLRVDPLSAGWTSQDLGLVGVPGYSTSNASTGVFTVAGSGNDLTGVSDRLQFAYQTLQGDGTIIAQLTNLDNTSANARAGVMIRQSLAADAPEAAMLLTYSNGARWLYRTAAGNGTASVNSGSGTYSPTWLKLQRVGNTFSAFTSASGTSWTQVGATQTIAMGETVYIGLAAAAANNVKLNAAAFSNVSVTGNLNPQPTLNSLTAPGGLATSSPTGSTLRLTWNAVSGATGYVVERSADGAVYSQVGTTSAPATSFSSTGLADGQRYYFRVRAGDAGGVSAPSAVAAGMTRAGAVSGLSAVPLSTTSITLNWSDAGGETGYRVERSVNGSTWTTLATLGSNIPSATATGLAEGTQYWFRVISLDAAGDASTSTVIEAATRWSGVVTGLAFTALGSGEISFRWNDVAGESSYLVERGLNSTDFSTVATLPAGATSYADTGLASLVDYYYRVTPLKQLADTTSYGQYHAGFFASTKAAAPLPAPWLAQDVGSFVGPGTAGYSNRTYSVLGAGATIGGTTDKFQFLYKPLQGDCSIIARVATIDGNDTMPTLAGVMIRESLSADSRYVAALNRWDLMLGGGVPRIQSRAATAGSTATTAMTDVSKWVRLTRVGATFTADYSSDGIAWTTIGSVTVSMAATIYVGMAVSAGTATQMASCKFDNVAVASAAPPVVADAPTSLEPTTGGLSVFFSEPVNGADRAENYSLVSLGPDGLLGTADDADVPATLSYAAGITMFSFAAIPASVYRLTVRDTITDADGKSLDGDADGSPGGDWSGDLLVLDNGSAFRTTNFGPGTSEARATAVQADGKTVVAGYAYNGSTYDFAVNRYNIDGSLDPAFGTGGRVTTPIGTSTDYAYALALQPDGKILVAGAAYSSSNYDFAVARYNVDGSLDPTFGTGGLVTTPIGTGSDYISGLAIQSDGKIVAAGYASIGSNNDFALVRYNADGSLDAGFGASGKVTTAIGTAGDQADAVAIQPDGKIVAAGYAYIGSNNDFALVRYNADGSLDAGFGTSGKVTTAFGTGNDYAYGVAIQPDGKIVAAGNGVVSGNSKFAVARYSSNGSLDTAFGTGGKVTTAIGSSGHAGYAMALQSDGKIVATGGAYVASRWDFAVARYNVDGSLDSSFDVDGKLNTSVGEGDYGRSVAIAGGGKIVVAGSAATGTRNDFAVVRYNADGGLDSSFDVDGKVVSPGGCTNDEGRGVAWQSDGKIVVAGMSSNGPSTDFAVARYNADGSLDSTFGGQGRLVSPIGTGADYGRAVAVQPDGMIVVAGYATVGSNYDFALARYRSDGSTDTSFGTGGKVTTAFGTNNDYAYAMALQADGKIVVAGVCYDGTQYDIAVARYNANGSLDTSFDGDGKAITAVGSGSDYAYGVAVQPDGKIVVAGYTTLTNNDFLAIRYNTDGSLDTGFGGSGMVITAVGTSTDNGIATAIQPDGKIVVAGYAWSNSTNDFALVRYNPDGSLDRTFNGDGKRISPIGDGNDYCYAVAVAPDGKIVAVGSANNGSVDDLAVARYNADGTPDTAFANHGKLVASVASSHDRVYSVAINPAGNILLAGMSYEATNAEMLMVSLTSAPASASLSSASGTRFDVDTAEWGAGQLIDATGGPFDGLGRLRVDGSDFVLQAAPTSDDSGQTIVLGGAASGLEVVREVTVPATGSENFVRTLDVFSNPTAGPIAATVTILGNLGSNAATAVWGTSDGDTVVEPADQWIGTDDVDGTLTPAVVHYIHGPGGLTPTSVDVLGDNIQWTYQVTIPAGQTVRFMYLTITATTRAQARSAAESLVPVTGLDAPWTAFLTSQELESIANFQFNHAPVLDPSAVFSLGAFNEDDATNGGTLVSAMLQGAGGDMITDADSGALEGIALVGVDRSYGDWQYKIGAAEWLDLGEPSPERARLLPSDSATWIRFVPRADWSGTLAHGITFQAWDQAWGGAGAVADVRTAGGYTAYSVAFATASIAVAAVNDPPLIAALDDSPDPIGEGQVVTLTASGVSDSHDPTGYVASVAFYRESNGNAGLQAGPGGDTPIGVDDDPAGGWSVPAATEGLAPGVYLYYAQATDNEGAASVVASTTATIRGPLADLLGAAFSVSPDHMPGAQTTVRYTIANSTAGAAGAFDVVVVLSDNDVLGDADDIVVATRSCPGVGAGASFTDSFLLVLPDEVRQSLYSWAKRDDPPGLRLPRVSTSRDYLAIVIDPSGAVAEEDESDNAGQGRGLDQDDFTYFPWDSNSSGQITPTDAIFVINRLGQSVSEGDCRADPDGSGSVTPTDAIGVINRLGYQSNAAVAEAASPAPTELLAGPAASFASASSAQAEPSIASEPSAVGPCGAGTGLARERPGSDAIAAFGSVLACEGAIRLTRELDATLQTISATFDDEPAKLASPVGAEAIDANTGGRFGVAGQAVELAAHGPGDADADTLPVRRLNVGAVDQLDLAALAGVDPFGELE